MSVTLMIIVPHLLICTEHYTCAEETRSSVCAQKKVPQHATVLRQTQSKYAQWIATVMQHCETLCVDLPNIAWAESVMLRAHPE